MKALISPMLVAIATVVLLSHLATGAAEQSSAGAVGAPAATEKVAARQAGPVQISPNVAEVLKLVRAQIHDDVIVAFVGSSKHTYILSANDILYLRKQGVSDRVITAMLEQRKQAPEKSATATPAPAQPPQNHSAAATSSSAQPATTYAAPTYVSTPTYVYPAPAYSYYNSYPYYYGGYWGIPFPALSFSFGFGHGYGHHGHGYYGGYHGHH